MLEARSLSKSYSSVPAVKELNFSLSQGQVLGCLGPNGSGKSILCSGIFCLCHNNFKARILGASSTDCSKFISRDRIYRRISTLALAFEG